MYPPILKRILNITAKELKMTSVTDFFSSIESQYINWFDSGEKTKEIISQVEDIDLKIIFNKGRWIYPMPNCPTPAVIENTINITSSNNDKIKNLFESTLQKEEKHFSFPSNKYNRFDIRFFSNESLIKEKLQEEEKAYAPYESPRWGLRHECILI